MMTVTTYTNPSVRPTDNPTESAMSAKSALAFLRATRLYLQAHKSEGRFICRVVNNSGYTVSLSSRSTLEEAVTIAVGNIS